MDETDLSQVPVPLIEEWCEACLSPVANEREGAQRLLLRFQESWKEVPRILEGSTKEGTRFFALQILQRLVLNRWGTIRRTDRSDIRNFVANTLSAAVVEADRAYVRKLDAVLVEILKHEWPHDWPDFIDTLLAASQLNARVCENNLVLLRMLSEEMHTYWEDRISSSKSYRLQTDLSSEIHKIFPLLNTILATVGQGPSDSLQKAAIEAVAHFIEWIDDEWIDGALIDLILPCLLHPTLQLPTLRALSLVATMTPSDEYDEEASKLGYQIMGGVEAMVPIDEANGRTYESWRETADSATVSALAILLTHIVGLHLVAYEDWAAHERFLRLIHHYLYKLSLLEDNDIVKICFDYWVKLVEFVHDDRTRLSDGPAYLKASSKDPDPPSDLAMLAKFTYEGWTPPEGVGSHELRSVIDKRMRMKPVLDDLRQVLMARIVPPAEVGYVEGDADAEGGRESFIDTENLALHAIMRDTLVYLSHLDFFRTIGSIKASLADQISGVGFSQDQLNRLCWLIGALSTRLIDLGQNQRDPLALALAIDTRLGILPTDQSAWFVDLVTGLLALAESRPDPKERMEIDCNVLFVLSRYPNFVQDNLSFLKLALEKIFGFLEAADRVPASVLERATDTLSILTYYCREELSEVQPGESESLIDYVLREKLAQLLVKLDKKVEQLQSIYKSLGSVIRHRGEGEWTNDMLSRLFAQPNQALSDVVTLLRTNPDALIETANSHLVYKILRLNSSVALSLRSCIAPQFLLIYPQLPILYHQASVLIARAAAHFGPGAADHSTIRALRFVRKQVIFLTSLYLVGVHSDTVQGISGVAPTANRIEYVIEEILPSLAAVVLPDMAASLPEFIEFQAVEFVDLVLHHVGGIIPQPFVTQLIEPVVELMVRLAKTGTSEDFIDLRRAGYFAMAFATSTRLLRVEYITPAAQTQLVDLCVYGMHVLNRDIAKNALVMSYHLFSWCPPVLFVPQGEPVPPELAFNVFHTHIRRILENVWMVMTDAEHKNTFENQTAVIARVFEILYRHATPMFEDSEYGPGISNEEWMQRWYYDSIVRTFPQLKGQEEGISDLFKKLWKLPRRNTRQEDEFGIHVRGFLLDLGQFRGRDNSALCIEAKEEEQRRLAESRQARMKSVSGLEEIEKPPDGFQGQRLTLAVDES